MERTVYLAGLIIPVLALVAGWWAMRAGHLSEFNFVYAILGPATFLIFGWSHFAVHRFADKWENRRQR
jgi:hypothetical protein